MDEQQGLLGYLENVDITKVSEELEFKIGEVEFKMEKMPALAAWKVLDKLREKLLGNIAVGNMQALLGLSSQYVEENLLGHMMESTRYKTPDMTKGTASLNDYPNKALNSDHGVEPTDIYQLIGRFLCINFPTLLRQIGNQIGKQEV